MLYLAFLLSIAFSFSLVLFPVNAVRYYRQGQSLKAWLCGLAAAVCFAYLASLISQYGLDDQNTGPYQQARPMERS